MMETVLTVIGSAILGAVALSIYITISLNKALKF